MIDVGLDIQFPQKTEEERMISFGCHKIIYLFKLEKTLKIIESNH